MSHTSNFIIVNKLNSALFPHSVVLSIRRVFNQEGLKETL